MSDLPQADCVRKTEREHMTALWLDYADRARTAAADPATGAAWWYFPGVASAWTAFNAAFA